MTTITRTRRFAWWPVALWDGGIAWLRHYEVETRTTCGTSGVTVSVSVPVEVAP